jgi:hypothetical protein
MLRQPEPCDHDLRTREGSRGSLDISENLTGSAAKATCSETVRACHRALSVGVLGPPSVWWGRGRADAGRAVVVLDGYDSLKSN